MTLFSVISFSDQGVYDVVNNLASLPARLIFQQIEETAYFLLSQKLNRRLPPSKQDLSCLKECTKVYKNLLKLMTLLGLVIFVFGVNFSELALFLYGGKNISLGIGSTLMKWQCFYICFISINGITECFTFAAMNEEQLTKYNRKMMALSVLFISSAYVLTRYFGSVGFIIANCVNMSARILHRYNWKMSFLLKY